MLTFILLFVAGVAHADHLYVSNETSGTVSVIDTKTEIVVSTIPVGKRPRGIQVNLDRQYVYVALSGSPAAGPGVDESKLPPPDRRLDGIGVISAKTRKLERVLDAGADPEQFAVGTDGKLYVANEDTSTATIMDPRSSAKDVVPNVGGEPEGVAVRPDGAFVYVTSEADNLISVIDSAQRKVVSTIAVPARPRNAAFLADGSKAYVTCESGGKVAVIDARKHQLLKTITLTGEKVLPMGIVLDPGRSRAYVTTGRGGQLISIDTKKDEVIAALDVGDRPWGVALSADGRTIYTANGPSNDVSVVDTRSFKVIKRLPVGNKPWGLALLRSR